MASLFTLHSFCMDNLTHTLVGAALAETGLKRVTPLATPTLLIAANLPDIDVVARGFGQLAFLHHHRGITHALVGLPVLAALLALIMWGGSRWLARQTGSPGARFGPLFGLSLLSIATHPLLDFTNAYGWRPFLPWSDRWFYGDIAFVIDIWIWAALGGALFIATTRRSKPFTRRLSLTLWAVLFISTGVIIARFDGAGVGIKLLWFAMVAVAVACRWLFPINERQARRLSLGLLTAVLVYFGTLTLVHRAALDQISTMAQAINNEQVTQISALSMPASPLSWLALVTTDQAFYLAELRLLSQPVSLNSAQRMARATGAPSAILAAHRTADGQSFLRFARFPASEVHEHGEQIEVVIRDLRFFPPSNLFTLRIRLDKNLHQIAEPSSN